MVEAASYKDLERQQQRLEALKLNRQPRYQHWQDITKYIIPYAGRYLVSTRDQQANRYQDIIDETGIQSAHTLRSGLMSVRTNPATKWFRSQTPDQDLNLYQPVREWLWNADMMARRILKKSRSNIALPHLYGESAIFGTGASITVDDFNTVIHHHLLTAGEYVIATDSRQRVNTLYREFQMTVAELVQEFGEDNVSKHVKKLYKNNRKTSLDTLIDVVHAIEPRMFDERQGDPRLSVNMPWKSCYFERGSNENKYLRIKGHRRFSCIVPRWDTNGGDHWGEGPGTVALGSVRELQEVQLSKARVIDHHSDPSLQVPAGWKGREADLFPGGRYPYDQNTPYGGVRNTHEVPMRLDYAQANIEDVRFRIRSSMHVDLFRPITQISDTTMRTAEEIYQRRAEGLTILGPVDFRYRDELDEPLLDIVYERMFEESLLPPPPPELEGMPIDLEYIGPLAQALRNDEAQATSNFRRHLGEIATFNPNVVDGYDGDEDLRRTSDMLGIDPSFIVAGEEVALIRQARAQAQQAQAQVAATSELAGATKDLASADTSGQNALTEMMAGGAG